MKKTHPKPELKMGTVIWRAAFPWLPATEKWEGPIVYGDTDQFKELFSLLKAYYRNITLDTAFPYIPSDAKLTDISFHVYSAVTVASKNPVHTWADVADRDVDVLFPSATSAGKPSAQRAVANSLNTLSRLNIAYAVTAALDTDRQTTRRKRTSPQRRNATGRKGAPRDKKQQKRDEQQERKVQQKRELIAIAKSEVHVIPVVARPLLHDAAMWLAQAGRWDEPILDAPDAVLDDYTAKVIERLRALTPEDIIGPPRSTHTPAYRLTLIAQELDETLCDVAVGRVFADELETVTHYVSRYGVSATTVTNWTNKVRSEFIGAIVADTELHAFFHTVAIASRTTPSLGDLLAQFPALSLRVGYIDAPVWRVVERLSTWFGWSGVHGFTVKDGAVVPHAARRAKLARRTPEPDKVWQDTATHASPELHESGQSAPSRIYNHADTWEDIYDQD